MPRPRLTAGVVSTLAEALSRSYADDTLSREERARLIEAITWLEQVREWRRDLDGDGRMIGTATPRRGGAA